MISGPTQLSVIVVCSGFKKPPLPTNHTSSRNNHVLVQEVRCEVAQAARETSLMMIATVPIFEMSAVNYIRCIVLAECNPFNANFYLRRPSSSPPLPSIPSRIKPFGLLRLHVKNWSFHYSLGLPSFLLYLGK